MRGGNREGRKGIIVRKKQQCMDGSNLHFSLSSSDKKLYMCKIKFSKTTTHTYTHTHTHTTHTHTHTQLTVVIGIFSDVVYELRMVVRFALQGSKVTS